MPNVGAKLDEVMGNETCVECDRGPLDDSRKKLGNKVALSSIPAGITGGLAIGNKIFGMKDPGAEGLARALEKANKPELAEKARDAKDLPDAIDALDSSLDMIYAEVQWEEVDGELLCYDCK